MAEGGEQLGLAQLELTVDQTRLNAGLDAAKDAIENFTPVFKGVDEALAELGARIDATFQRLGTLPVGGLGPASPAAPPSTPGGSRSVGTSPAAANSKEERLQTLEAQKQTEEGRKLRTELVRTGIRGKGATVDAPQRLTLASREPIPGTLSIDDAIERQQKRLNQTLSALNQNVRQSNKPDKPPVVNAEVTTDLPRGAEPPKIADLFRQQLRAMAESDARLYRGLGESLGNINEFIDQIEGSPRRNQTGSPQERLAIAREKLQALGAAPPKPSSERKRFGSGGIEAADPAAVAAWKTEKAEYEKWSRQYRKLKKEEVAAANEVVAAERKSLKQRPQSALPAAPRQQPLEIATPQIPLPIADELLLGREQSRRRNARRAETLRAREIADSAPPLPPPPAPKPSTEQRQAPLAVTSDVGAISKTFAALKATCEQLQACFTEFLPACKAAAEALRGIAAGGRGATGVTAGAPRSTAGSPSRPRPRTITPSSENRLLNFADAASAPDSNATLRQLRRARSLLLDQREGAEAGSPRSQRLTDSINRLSTRIDRAVKVGRETQGVEGIRPNAKERLQNFQRPARASVESLERRGAPQRTTQELRDLIGRVFKAQGASDFGAAERARREFDSRLRTARIRQSTTERTAIGDRRERLDEFRTVRDISNEQFQLNRAKAQGVNITEAQVRLDRAAQLAKEGRRQEARDYVLQSRETRRNTQLEVQTLQKREREERAQRTQREAAKDRGSRLDRSIREIEQRSPAFLKQSGVNPQLLRRDLGAVREAQAKGDFESAKNLGAELRRRITSSLDKLRAFEAEINKGFKQAPRTGGLEQGRRAGTRVDDLEQRVTKLKSQGFDTKPFEEGIAQARKKLVEGQLLSAQRQIESISRRVKSDETFIREDSRVRRSFESEIGRRARIGGASEPLKGRATLEGSPAFLTAQAKQAADARRAAEQEAKRQAAEQRAADRRATVPAISTETRERLAAQLQNKQLDVEKLGDIGGNIERFKARLDKARQDLLDGNVRAVEREIRRLGPDLRQATATTKRDNAAAKAPLSFGSAQEAAAFAPRIETPAQLKQYEAALKALKAQTAATDGAFNPLNAVLKQVSATLKGGTSDAAAFAGGLKKVREEAARVKPPELGAPLPPPRPGAPPPPPRPTTDERRRALEAEDARRRVPARPPALPLPPAQRGPGLLERGRNFFGNQRVQGALSSGLIGGGFPLLFGQGVGASAGGLLGGVVGGALGGGFGFGASIVGTIIGDAVDALVQRSGELAKALQDPVASLDAFIQNATLASAAQEKYVQALVSAGREAEAAKVIRDEAGRTIDPAGAALLADAQDRYNRAISDAQDLLGNFVAGPASEFLNFVTNLVKAAGLVPASTPDSLTGPRAGQNARTERINGLSAIGTGAGIALGGAALSFANPFVGVPAIGAGLTVAGVGFGQVQSADAKQRVRDSVDVQNAERELEATRERQRGIEEQINKAKASGNTFLVDSLQGSKQLLAIDEQRKQAITQAQAAFNALKPEEQLNQDNIDTRDQAIATANATARTQGQEAVASQQGRAAAAQKELEVSKRLVGLSQNRLQIEQSRIAIEKAARERDTANQLVRDTQVNRDRGLAGDDELLAVNALREQAEARYTQTVLEESKKRRRAIAAENVQRLEAVSAIERSQQRLQVAELGPGLSGDARQAIEAVQSIQNAERESSIAQARLAVDPGDPTLQANASIAAQNIAIASKEAKNALSQAFQNAQSAVQAIARSVEDAALRLSALRAGNQGVNQFLDRGARQRRQQEEFQNQLLPQFLSIREELAGQQSDPSVARSIRNVNFQGPLESVNNDLIKFIEAARQELRGQQDIARGEQQLTLAQANEALIGGLAANYDASTELATAISALSNKDWNVYVNVENGSASGDLVPTTSML